MEEVETMDFLEMARARYSVLEYTQQAVEQEKIDKIIEAGLAAPTACNNQPQRILVIDNDEGRQKLNRVIPSKYYVPLAFLICYHKQECWIRPMDGKSSGEIDASIVTTHMMLEATDLGLGSIWVMYWDPAKLRSEFYLDNQLEPVALLVVGYKAESAKPREGHLNRKSRNEIKFGLERTMQIRTASAEEMLALWGYQSPVDASPTAQFFYRNISTGNAVFWTIKKDNALIGELYGFLNLTDKDFADGTSTAYLCAFRVREALRGQGLGSRLLETALADLKRRGFRQATIGVSPDEPQNIRLYRRHGFLRKIKDCHYDPCGLDAAGNPDYDPKGWWLLAKDLTEDAR